MKILQYMAVVVLIICTSCQKEEIKTYQGVNNIYFSPAWVPIVPGAKLTDSLYVSFVFETNSVNEMVVKIPVRVQGRFSETERMYQVELGAASSAEEGVDISPVSGTHTFKANQEVDTLQLSIYRHEVLKSETKYAEINLLPSSDFSTELEENIINESTGEGISCLTFRLYFNDILGVQKNWSVGYLGTYSEKKLRLISEVMDLPLNYFSGDISPSVKQVRYIAKTMQIYLDEQAANGTPVLEEDGTPMKMADNL